MRYRVAYMASQLPRRRRKQRFYTRVLGTRCRPNELLIPAR